ncbi:hypothetical protein D9757_001098 [Collybiopsis confluens]|uniref:Uncharacterized protein n=1 Tax=Collybiopsis confluens TaxID=2823264 RepID=A0A8H5MGD9_9AGAR|nr:hypothetical protein D9757_001098 [Collybiopsis confluens]
MNRGASDDYYTSHTVGVLDLCLKRTLWFGILRRSVNGAVCVLGNPWEYNWALDVKKILTSFKVLEQHCKAEEETPQHPSLHPNTTPRRPEPPSFAQPTTLPPIRTNHSSSHHMIPNVWKLLLAIDSTDDPVVVHAPTNPEEVGSR